MASSAGASTCRTDDSTGPIAPSPAPAAARAPATGRVVRRGHHDDGVSRRRGRRCAAGRRRAATRCGSRPSTPPYLDKTNATADPRRAAARPSRRRPYDVGGSVRSAVGCARASRLRRCAAPTLVVSQPTCAPACPAAPTRRPAATRPRRCCVGERRRRPVLAERRRRRARRPRSSSTAGGCPATPRSKRLGGALRRDHATSPLAERGAGRRRSRRPGIEPRRRSTALVVTGLHERACAAVAQAAASPPSARRRPHGTPSATPAPRSPLLLLAAALEQAAPGPGHRAGRARRRRRRAAVPRPPTRSAALRRRRPVAAQIAAGAPMRYGKLPGLARHAARRAAAPARAGPAVGERGRPLGDWKFGFVGSATTGRHLPPADHATAADGRRLGTSSRSRSTSWPTRRARRSCSRSSTSTAAAGSRSSSPTSTPTRSQIGDAGRDDVPPAVHRRRHPQLLLEGPAGRALRQERPMGSHGIKDRVAIVGMGCTPLRRALGQGRSTTCSSTPSTRRSPSPASTKDDVDAYWLGTAQSGMSGITLARPLQLDDKPVTRVENFCATGSEALRQAVLRGRVRRVRHRDGGRRREAQGLRLLGPRRVPDPPNDGTQRARSPRRRCSRMVAPGLREEVRRRRRRDARTCSPASRGRTTATARATRGRSSARRCRWRRSAASPHGRRAARRLRLRGRRRRLRRPRSSCAPRTRTSTPTSRCYMKALSFVAGNGSGLDRPDYDYTTFPEVVALGRGRLRAGRHHRPARRARDGRGARLLHARPSWC